jgi:hypothetical protein
MGFEPATLNFGRLMALPLCHTAQLETDRSGHEVALRDTESGIY